MRSIRANWLAILLLLASFIAPIAVYHRLPAQIPIHWNVDDVIDGWASRPLGVFGLPCLNVLLIGLLLGAPTMRRSEFETEFSRYQPMLVAGAAGTLLYAELLILRSSLGGHPSIGRHILILVGAVCMLLGNYFGKSTQNIFFGIRTPWALANENVWERTHRFGGKIWVGCGLAFVALGIIGVRSGIATASLVAIAGALPVGYSYLVWRRTVYPPKQGGG